MSRQLAPAIQGNTHSAALFAYRLRNSTGENVATNATTNIPINATPLCAAENTAQLTNTQNAIFALAATYTQSENLCWSFTKSISASVGNSVAGPIDSLSNTTGNRFTASTIATHTTGAHPSTNLGCTNHVTVIVASTFTVAPAFTTAGK